MAHLGRARQDRPPCLECYDTSTLALGLLFIVCEESYHYCKYSLSGRGIPSTPLGTSRPRIPAQLLAFAAEGRPAPWALPFLLAGERGALTPSARGPRGSVYGVVSLLSALPCPCRCPHVRGTLDTQASLGPHRGPLTVSLNWTPHLWSRLCPRGCLVRFTWLEEQVSGRREGQRLCELSYPERRRRP